ncbi:MAG: hypothetical protein AB1650_07790 [Candidatus Omnitrophota bacterium]
MTEWLMEPTDTYVRAYKWHEKKKPSELIAVLDNLDRYFKIISHGTHPQFVVLGCIHDEGKGIRAIDQKGGGKGKLRQTRLYVYPDIDQKILYLITIGDKNSQKDDVKLSADFVISLKGV